VSERDQVRPPEQREEPADEELHVDIDGPFVAARTTGQRHEAGHREGGEGGGGHQRGRRVEHAHREEAEWAGLHVVVFGVHAKTCRSGQLAGHRDEPVPVAADHAARAERQREAHRRQDREHEH
jgi:hypothetical protein